MLKFNLMRGFTLIELLIVISIIGILAASLITPAPRLIDKARDVQVKQELHSIRVAIKNYWTVHNGKYPSSLKELIPDYIEKIPEKWQGSRASGVFVYFPEKGQVLLGDLQGRVGVLPLDKNGKDYDEY